MKKTLDNDEIETSPAMSRRSSMAAIGASVAVVAGVVGTGVNEAQAQCTDSDGGPHADPGGHGRRCRHGGCTDSDGGHHADPAGGGRHCGGHGHHRCSDSDGGHYADPAGRGRHC